MSHHIVSPKVYYLVFATLMVLTGVTIWVAFYDLGAMSTVVALAIAFSKAILVVLYFMHVRYSSRLIQITVAAGFLWLAFLIGITMSDYISRDWLPVPPGW